MLEQNKFNYYYSKQYKALEKLQLVLVGTAFGNGYLSPFGEIWCSKDSSKNKKCMWTNGFYFRDCSSLYY